MGSANILSNPFQNTPFELQCSILIATAATINITTTTTGQIHRDYW